MEQQPEPGGAANGDRNTFEKRLRHALALDFPYPDEYHRKVLERPKENLRPAAVLLLFAMDHAVENKTPALLYILRTETVLTHKGQISFPGGHCDPEDQGNPISTALRETYEEVGVLPENIQI